ncbi:hypothetical protein Sa4125_00050 [Aureimonas sp. SA4125]|uniref:hypothetical protein n=1 Tax=Aureimonas sp. SA4125 TaxID=2826993 RepID=UPI001CC717A4|nr:hypothetical protein [Aureimonas sp. SA4125]BDA82463.1 hypothetical protein Sa4125_00050 [Aureimonas sp. SA4125]
MRISKLATLALATALSLGSFAASADARESSKGRDGSPPKTIEKCHVERVKVRRNGRVVTVKKRVCERVAAGRKGR